MKNQDNQSKDLEGKIALVTGGTKGIGKAIANRLAQGGAKLIVTARNHPKETDINYHFIAADLSLASDVNRVADEINELFGGVDILINNMGANTYPGAVMTHWQMSIGMRHYRLIFFHRYAWTVLYYPKCWKRKAVLSFIFLLPAVSFRFGNLPWPTALLKLL